VLNRRWLVSPALILTWSLSAGAQSSTPQQHVDAARTLLGQVSDKSLKKNGRARVEELRKLFDEMAKAYPNSADWRTKFSAVESQLTRIIGGGRGPGLEAATSGAGTSGTPIGSGAALGNQVGTTSGAETGVTVGGATGQAGTGSAGTTGSGGTTGNQTGASTGGATVMGSGSGTGGASGIQSTGSTGTVAGVQSGAAATGSVAQAGDIGPAGSAAVGAGQGGGTAVGAGSGIAVIGEIGMKDIDPAVREQLRMFRLEVELFFASALTDNLGVSTNQTAKP
jgi:hypothetical protein